MHCSARSAESGIWEWVSLIVTV